MAAVSLEVESGTRAPYITARQLGLVAMDEDNGTTQATGEANSALLNTYFSTGWRTQGKMLVLDAKGYGIWDTIVIPRIEGLSIRGAGVGDTRAEAEFATYGGACSRIVNLQSANDVMIDYSGMGLSIEGVQIQGWWHSGNGATLKAATSDHARIGILQRCGDGTVGSGKVNSPALVFSCCDVAIKMGDSWDGDNADQWTLGSLRCLDCRVGIHSIARQAVGSWIGQYEGTRCGTMLYLERGGKWHIGQATMENTSPIFLRARAQTFDDNSVSVDELYCDGSVTGSPEILKMDATVANGDDGIEGNDDDESTASLFLRLGLLTIVAAGGAPKPTITVRGYSRVHILSGEQLYDEMITIIGGSASYMNEVIVKHCRFRLNETPANIVVASGSGYAKVIMEHNGTIGNVPVNNSYRYWIDGSFSTYNPASI